MINSSERQTPGPETLDVFVERQIQTNVEDAFELTHARGCLAVVVDLFVGKRRVNLILTQMHRTELARLCKINVKYVDNYFETAWLSGPLATSEEFLKIKLESVHTNPKGLEETALIHFICARYFEIKREREEMLKNTLEALKNRFK